MGHWGYNPSYRGYDSIYNDRIPTSIPPLLLGCPHRHIHKARGVLHMRLASELVSL